MPSDPTPVQIDLTPRFQKDLHTLAKRYRRIRSDLQPLINKLEAGELPGDQVSGMKLAIFKVRVKNSGYRVIYYLKDQGRIILVTMYSKSDQPDVDIETVRQAIAQYEQ